MDITYMSYKDLVETKYDIIDKLVFAYFDYINWDDPQSFPDDMKWCLDLYEVINSELNKRQHSVELMTKVQKEGCSLKEFYRRDHDRRACSTAISLEDEDE